MNLRVYNPLPIAYSHREKQLVEIFDGLVQFTRSSTEGMTGWKKVSALVSHLRVIRKLRSTSEPVLVTWPLLGWLEVILWARRNSQVYLSVHDPKPLRRQIGLGRVAAQLARLVPPNMRPTLICHSSIAADETIRILPGTSVISLPLPMIRPKLHATSEKRPRTVLVLGQYKPARDLDFLELLGPQRETHTLKGSIAGRGWPQVTGWDVTDRFLSEKDFDDLLSRAGCLLIPYRHYFQSGVALRAVELGTPVVGAAHPYLCDSLGLSDTSGIVASPDSTNSWLEAIENSINSDSYSTNIFGKTQDLWKEWLSTSRARSRRQASGA